MSGAIAISAAKFRNKDSGQCFNKCRTMKFKAAIYICIKYIKNNKSLLTIKHPYHQIESI